MAKTRVKQSSTRTTTAARFRDRPSGVKVNVRKDPGSRAHRASGARRRPSTSATRSAVAPALPVAQKRLAGAEASAEAAPTEAAAEA